MELLSEQLGRKYRAPEVYGDVWYNSDPLPISGLLGSVVMVEFWDMTSRPSIRAVPYLSEWDRRYRERGLVTLAVHTPRFEFARDPALVRRAIQKLGISYPVVLDNDYHVWNAYRATAWPSRFLADKNGILRYAHVGDGSFSGFEQAIQSLLTEASYQPGLPPLMEPLDEADRAGAICFKATPEILVGWQRGTIGNIEGVSPEATISYRDPGIHPEGRLFLEGTWRIGRSNITLSEQEGETGSLTVGYRARGVYAVIGPEGERNFQVTLLHDGAALTAANSGGDVFTGPEGGSFIRIDEHRLYHLVDNREFGEHTLTMKTRSNGFTLYAVSFGTCAVPELMN